MVDFHTHILPGIDDGSANTTVSIEMLKQLKKQGVDRVVATPHFYMSSGSIEKFLECRNRVAIEVIEAARKEAEPLPKIALGAEVLMYPGIGGMEELSKLCIEGTRYMLLEMPFVEWSNITYTTVDKICAMGITPIIAHFERYINVQEDRGFLYELIDMGCLIQTNAEYVNSVKTSRKALKHISEGHVHIIGSDCHNLTDRKPNIGKAYEKIEKKLGRGEIRNLRNIVDMVLEDAEFLV
ncbi:MAG: capsular polysaccharide biosynthesis protein [Clostridia bacterium]|nr:capsular polysaccharide biosynthesis protein [Clostridia bacterium]